MYAEGLRRGCGGKALPFSPSFVDTVNDTSHQLGEFTYDYSSLALACIPAPVTHPI